MIDWEEAAARDAERFENERADYIHELSLSERRLHEKLELLDEVEGRQDGLWMGVFAELLSAAVTGKTLRPGTVADAEALIELIADAAIDNQDVDAPRRARDALDLEDDFAAHLPRAAA